MNIILSIVGVLGSIYFFSALMVQGKDLRSKRASESLYDNIYSALADFTDDGNDNNNDPLPELKRPSRRAQPQRAQLQLNTNNAQPRQGKTYNGGDDLWRKKRSTKTTRGSLDEFFQHLLPSFMTSPSHSSTLKTKRPPTKARKKKKKSKPRKFSHLLPHRRHLQTKAAVARPLPIHKSVVNPSNPFLRTSSTSNFNNNVNSHSTSPISVVSSSSVKPPPPVNNNVQSFDPSPAVPKNLFKAAKLKKLHIVNVGKPPRTTRTTTSTTALSTTTATTTTTKAFLPFLSQTRRPTTRRPFRPTTTAVFSDILDTKAPTRRPPLISTTAASFFTTPKNNLAPKITTSRPRPFFAFDEDVEVLFTNTIIEKHKPRPKQQQQQPFFQSLISAQPGRQGQTRQVIVDGFPAGLPSGTPVGVQIALASAQNRECE